MSTPNKSIHRATIALDVPAKIADVILYANNIVQKMTNNPAFPTPTPKIAALSAAVADLHAAQTTSLSRAKGAATVRNGDHAGQDHDRRPACGDDCALPVPGGHTQGRPG
jgi:hypothetical protein